MNIKERQIITDLSKLDKLGRSEEIDLIKENKLVREIVSQLKRIMRKNNLTSLSAPAIGYNKRIFCIDFSDKEIKTFINPLVTNLEGIELTREVCSSIPNKEFIRPRNKVIDIIFQTPTGQTKSLQFKGLASSVVQHEIDHLEGVTLVDIGLEIEEDFNEASEEEQLEIIDMYLDSIDLSRESIYKDLNSDDDIRKILEADKLYKMLGEGKIELEAVQGVKEDE